LAPLTDSEYIDRMVNTRGKDERQTGKKAKILAAAQELLRSGGLTEWSIEGCSQRARCAKGLVLHYFGSKRELLHTVALDLSARRATRWRSALQSPGIEGIESLWRALAEEVGSGAARALIELRLSGVEGTTLSAEDLGVVAASIAKALERPADLFPPAATLEPILEGYALALLAGAPADEVREAFLGYWISFLRD
jgi:AcrR family transcriptional regulator